MDQDFSIVIPSNRPLMAEETRKCLKDFNCYMLDGAGYPSFSKLINDCILKADKETVIIANDKVRPNSDHIKKMLFLLKKGFGFVGLFRFGFFGLTKNLIRTIGFFDERFLGGGFEDSDFGKRFIEHDIAIYESPEVPYIGNVKSSWNNKTAEEFYKKKWHISETHWKRLLENEKYDYDLGNFVGNANWLPYKYSLLSKSSIVGHLKLKMFNDKPIDLSYLKCSEIF